MLLLLRLALFHWLSRVLLPLNLFVLKNADEILELLLPLLHLLLERCAIIDSCVHCAHLCEVELSSQKHLAFLMAVSLLKLIRLEEDGLPKCFQVAC